MGFKISNILHPEVYDHPVKNIELIETHISWIVLTGDFAYKIKKPVNFGFLDFSTLEKRRFLCEQELLLNRRLAAALYLDVVSITGTFDKPVITITNTTANINKSTNNAFEYAVKMRQFPQSAQLDNMLAAGELHAEHMERIALLVADFHQQIPVADKAVNYGDSDVVYQPVEENFTQINEHLATNLYTDRLHALQSWNAVVHKKLKPVFEQRKMTGFIRECHGDMHLRNMLWLDNKPMAFDCIEFNPELRWIDVISEIAFLVMDLQDRKQVQLANRFLNTYLEMTGDYAGLSVLPFYLCYRALVRAKVNALFLEQNNLSKQKREQSLVEFESYLELAISYTQQSSPKLILMRGVSASGKSTVSKQLLDEIGAIRIRSDIERKRLFSIDAIDNTLNEINDGIYSTSASEKTYNKVLELAESVISAGYNVIVDAAFLKKEQREPFKFLAKRLNVPYVILEITAPADVLRQRIVERKNDVSDADLAVLNHQLSNWQALDKNEIVNAISVHTEQVLDIDKIINSINAFNINTCS